MEGKHRDASGNEIKVKMKNEPEVKLTTKEDRETKVMMIGNLKPARLLKVPITVHDKYVLAMIDTGTNYSYISLDFANQLALDIDATNTKNIVAYGNNTMETKGTVMIDIRVGSMNIRHEFNILKEWSVNFEVIFGTDFMKNHNVILDLQKRIAT